MILQRVGWARFSMALLLSPFVILWGTLASAVRAILFDGVIYAPKAAWKCWKHDIYWICRICSTQIYGTDRIGVKEDEDRRASWAGWKRESAE